MCERVVEMLRIRREGAYVDATVGLGGHAEAIVRELGPRGRLIGIDRDEEAIREAASRLADSRVTLVRGDFSDMEEMVRAQGILHADGILFDLGISSAQLRTPERGFSFASDAPLDMRMDKSQPLTARDIVNRYPEEELERLLREYGEERHARRIAAAIKRQRAKKPIETCAELARIVEQVYRVRGRIHPATKTFQALRIAVNRELDELREALSASVTLLARGGRLCVISYHSLEDRIVKHCFADQARKGLFSVLTKKPITPRPDELRGNPSSRSAKLRVAERL